MNANNVINEMVKIKLKQVKNFSGDACHRKKNAIPSLLNQHIMAFLAIYQRAVALN